MSYLGVEFKFGEFCLVTSGLRRGQLVRYRWPTKGFGVYCVVYARERGRLRKVRVRSDALISASGVWQQ